MKIASGVVVGLAIGFVAARIFKGRQRGRSAQTPHPGSVVVPPSPN